MHFLITAYVENTDMLHNYSTYGDLDQFLEVKMGKIEIFWRRQCIISSMQRWRKVICYLMMPLVVVRSLSKGNDYDKLVLVKMGRILYVWKFKAIYLPLN